ncbi:MAG TPA: hypothetical protein VFQ72_00320 [Candidatus Paceibacterota bacterium]|nr:hypothetical protein [Candidatus Paceibacterota bacterium]
MTLYGIFNWLFNYPLYMGVIAWLGAVKGGLVMTSLSFIQCGVLLVVFDKMGIDWVGVTYVEDVMKKKEKNWAEKAIVWAVKKEHQTFSGRFLKALGFIAMSVFVDPFVVAVHYRKAHFAGVSKRDWQILFGSVFFGNLYWIIRTGLLVKIIEVGWKYVHG